MPPPRPALTAQRSRSNRIQYAGCFIAVLLVVAYGSDSILQQYSENPANENLLLAVITTVPFFALLFWAAKILVPKVEFFEDHLAARSLWGLSRKRSYQEISELAVKRHHLFITFTDRSRIALHPEEIQLGDLTRWLVERDVSAAQDVNWKPRRTPRVWGPKQKAFSPATLQNKATSSPIGTLIAPLWARLAGGAFFGGMLLANVIAVYGVADKYFETLDNVWIFWSVFLTLSNGIWIIVLASMLIPKEDLYEDHILIRSMWGRTRRRSYQEITKVAEDETHFFFIFSDGEILGSSKNNIDVAGLARFLADRGVTSAQDVEWW